jgi:hypothetical protein
VLAALLLAGPQPVGTEKADLLNVSRTRSFPRVVAQASLAHVHSAICARDSPFAAFCSRVGNMPRKRTGAVLHAGHGSGCSRSGWGCGNWASMRQLPRSGCGAADCQDRYRHWVGAACRLATAHYLGIRVSAAWHCSRGIPAVVAAAAPPSSADYPRFEEFPSDAW